MWIQISNTPWEYDSNAYENLPENRKRFWDRKKNITIEDLTINIKVVK